MFYFHPENWGKISNLTCSYFSDGLVKNHQPVIQWCFPVIPVEFVEEHDEVTYAGELDSFCSLLRPLSWVMFEHNGTVDCCPEHLL